MIADVVDLLRCPTCGGDELSSTTFCEGENGEIADGVVWCAACRAWYPVGDGVLELLVGDLVYTEDRRRFADVWSDQLESLRLPIHATRRESEQALQRIQQEHSDWYSCNDTQTYTQLENMPFWQAVNRIASSPWRGMIEPGDRLLELGCAQGRSTFQLMDLEIDVVAFDVSKALVRQAAERFRKGQWRARATFIVADGSRFPFVDGAFEHVLASAVLHHLPDPERACQEIARVLRVGGVYHGVENNRTFLRSLFESVQKIRPLWHEEAGPEPVMSRSDLERWCRSTGLEISATSSVFLPPHLINHLSAEGGYRLLAFTDRLCNAIPYLRHQGGLVQILGVKQE